jgi:four helix bundle protein
MSAPVRSYRDLVVWQKAMDLVDRVEGIVARLTSFQRWWLGLQMLRAALSIASNIAEGHDDEHTRVYLRRLADAKGSTRETETQLLVLKRRQSINALGAELDSALQLTDEIGRMLRSLSARVRSSLPRSKVNRPARLRRRST